MALFDRLAAGHFPGDLATNKQWTAYPIALRKQVWERWELHLIHEKRTLTANELVKGLRAGLFGADLKKDDLWSRNPTVTKEAAYDRWAQILFEDDDELEDGCEIGRCPHAPNYFLSIKLEMPTRLIYTGWAISLFDLLEGQHETPIAIYLDLEGHGFTVDDLAPTATRTYVRAQAASLLLDLSPEAFERLRNVVIWAPEMLASFRHDDLKNRRASGRLVIPRAQLIPQGITIHPRTFTALSPGSQFLHVTLEILRHPAQYIHAEMVANSRSDRMPSGEPYTALGFINMGVSWAVLAETGMFWDYKARLEPVWGSNIRLGSYRRYIRDEGFSNLHYGYVGAAGGLTLEDTRKISAAAPGEEPAQDIFAIDLGHALFTEHHGDILVNELKFHETVGAGIIRTTTRDLVGTQLVSAEAKQRQPEEIDTGSLFGPTERYVYEYVYTRQPVKHDVTFEQVKKALLAYQCKHGIEPTED